ncbi:MAG: BatA domain-containing protein [Flavobacteriaceae bacterium]|nr:BatA domain-containing protein [Flavobacteriaceae bacterium]
MQFEHPEILYFLAFLLVPIIVHLFQLQKFKRTPFTNVAFLQKLAQQTRKSSKLKKWLILTARLLLFSAVIFAFSQPYFSDIKAKKTQHFFIYLDNSLSLNSKGEKGNLLQTSIKEIIENISEGETYNLLTNSNYYENLSSNELKNVLLKLQPEALQRDLKEVLLKIDNIKSTKTKTLYKNILISDFQSIKKENKIRFTNVTQPVSLIKLQNSQNSNLSIDSVYVQNSTDNNFTLYAIVKNQGEAKKNIPISLYKDTVIFSKQTFSIAKNEKKSISFPIQNTSTFNGKITLDFSDIYNFDNSFFFNINNTKKINVFSIGKQQDFIEKIYSKNEFNFSSSSLQYVNYNLLESQELIILNELTEIPNTLTTFLQQHLAQQKSLVIIPNKQISIVSYNTFLQKLNTGSIRLNKNDSVTITSINFQHPFFKNVFSKKVSNFQYPSAKSYYQTQLNRSATLLSYNNKLPFLSKVYSKTGNVYWFSNSLDTQISNFINSPLVVAVFYNFGKLSAQYPQLAYRIGNENQIDIPVSLEKNQILKLKKEQSIIIPLQQTYASKTSLHINEQLQKQGFYTVLKENDSIATLAFNYPTAESLLNFLPISELIKDNKKLYVSNSVKDVLKKNKEKNKVTWLWKWFLTLAIVSLLFEILILKFFKP